MNKMKNKLYAQIGSIVTYIRSNEKGEVNTGTGSVQAIFLDPRNRLMARVKDGEKDYNVDYSTLGYSEDTLREYKECLSQVMKITKEGNDLVQKTVASYNAKVEAAYAKFLGNPVVCEVSKAPSLATVDGESVERVEHKEPDNARK